MNIDEMANFMEAQIERERDCPHPFDRVYSIERNGDTVKFRCGKCGAVLGKSIKPYWEASRPTEKNINITYDNTEPVIK